MSMKRKKLIIILACIFLFESILVFLAFGKVTKVEISNYGRGVVSYWICKGELVGVSGSFNVAADADASLAELSKSIETQNEDLTYINNYLFGNGLSNDEVILAIKERCETKGAAVTVEDDGIGFVGLIWIAHKFLN